MEVQSCFLLLVISDSFSARRGSVITIHVSFYSSWKIGRGLCLSCVIPNTVLICTIKKPNQGPMSRFCSLASML